MVGYFEWEDWYARMMGRYGNAEQRTLQRYFNATDNPETSAATIRQLLIQIFAGITVEQQEEDIETGQD